MHRPVGACVLTELARPVERVHDPDPVGVETRAVVRTLFGQYDVLRPQPFELGDEKLMRMLVACVPQRVGVVVAHP